MIFGGLEGARCLMDDRIATVIDRGWENYQTLMTGHRSMEALGDNGIMLLKVVNRQEVSRMRVKVSQMSDGNLIHW